jgi:hypothetical protein
MLPILIDFICSRREAPRNHCRACRLSPQFREHLSEAYQIPEGGIEVCPFGVTALQFSGEHPAPPTERLWTELHTGADAFEGDAAKEIARIDNIIQRTSASCGCVKHSTDYVKSNPPDFSSRKRYRGWQWFWHNHVSRERTHQPEITLDEAEKIHGWGRAVLRPQPVYVHSSATGLGDAISGIYAVCGLADALKAPVVFCSHSEEWLHRVHHPNLHLIPIERKRVGPDINDGKQGYNRQINCADSRSKEYCKNIAAALSIPEFGPRRPQEVDRSIHNWKPCFEKYAVLSPFSCFSSREWPRDRWGSLARRLAYQDVVPFVVCSEHQQKDAEKLFSGIDCVIWAGQPAGAMLDLISAATIVIGNDSGIVHVGGLMGVPTIAVHAGSLPHDFLYDSAPSVISVTANMRQRRSDHNPMALHSISVDQVMEQVGNAIRFGKRELQEAV